MPRAYVSSLSYASTLYLIILLTFHIETLLTPERFADIFCTDCDLPPERFAPEIAATIHEHLQAHARTLHTRAHRLPAAASATNTGAVAPIIPIELHVQLGRTLLHDKFHWDTSILNMLTPEAFAEQLVADMGLGSGEHVQLVAHAIREQLVQYHQAADDDEEREDLEAEEVEMMAVRDGRMVREWGPRVDVMSAEDWAEVLRTQERESRYAMLGCAGAVRAGADAGKLFCSIHYTVAIVGHPISAPLCVGNYRSLKVFVYALYRA